MDQASPPLTSKKSTAKRYSLEEREQILKEFHQSGLSAYRFCQDRLLTNDTLLKWLSPGQKKTKKILTSNSGFVKIQMDSGAQQPMIIRLPRGCSIEIYHPNQIRWALDLVNAHLDVSC
ncbi:hypothetical protein OAM01_00130 [bacterium]|nr:hypothetical protein [bacterium]